MVGPRRPANRSLSASDEGSFSSHSRPSVFPAYGKRGTRSTVRIGADRRGPRHQPSRAPRVMARGLLEALDRTLATVANGKRSLIGRASWLIKADAAKRLIGLGQPKATPSGPCQANGLSVKTLRGIGLEPTTWKDQGMSDVCRWGFLSTAGIGRKNWKGIRRSGNGVVAAVASRDSQKARTFIDECQGEVPLPVAPKALGGYEALLADPDIDAVYVPLPTGMRREWVIRAAEAGKHVLCEKPCAPSLADLTAMTDACRANNVQFMDGVMFMHSKRLPALRAVLDDQDRMGQLRRIGIQFSFCGPDSFFEHDIRTHSELEPQGCLGDLGWYCIRQTLWAVKGELPSEVSARILTEAGQPGSPGKVPVEFSAEMRWSNGVSASFYCSFITENQQFVRFCGSKGYAQVDDFVLPFLGSELKYDVANHAFTVLGCDFNMEQHVERRAVHEYANGWPTAQEANMARSFGQLVLSGKPDGAWPKWSLVTQSVLDACLESARSGRSVSPQAV